MKEMTEITEMTKEDAIKEYPFLSELSQDGAISLIMQIFKLFLLKKEELEKFLSALKAISL